jgi:hypothetical protein
MMANGCHFDMLSMKAPTSQWFEVFDLFKGGLVSILQLVFLCCSKMRNKLSLDVCQKILFDLYNS